MRLALAGPFPPWRGGIAQFTLRLEQALSGSAAISRISFSRLYPGFLFPGTSQLDPGSHGGHQADVLIDSSNPLSWRRSARRASGLGAGAVIAQYWHPFFVPSLAAGLPPPGELPRVAVCHNVLPHDRFPFAAGLARAFLRSCGLLVVHGAPDAEEARAIAPGSRVLKLFHPVYDQYVRQDGSAEDARASLGLDPDRRIVLFFGLVRPYKGLEDLLEAIAILRGGPGLLVAGEAYSDREALRRRMERPDLAGRVRWIDRFIPDAEVDALFRAADIVALPYRSATQSGVAQIALAFRKPLVLTRTGGLPELVEEGRTGFLAEPRDPDSLAAAIEEALVISEEAGTADAVARVAARFGWDEYARRLQEALP